MTQQDVTTRLKQPDTFKSKVIDFLMNRSQKPILYVRNISLQYKESSFYILLSLVMKNRLTTINRSPEDLKMIQISMTRGYSSVFGIIRKVYWIMNFWNRDERSQETFIEQNWFVRWKNDHFCWNKASKSQKICKASLHTLFYHKYSFRIVWGKGKARASRGFNKAVLE